MKRYRTLLMAFVCFVLLTASMTMAFDFSKIEKQVVEFKLDNGLKFIVLPRHDAPVVSFVTIADIGGTTDPKGAAGLAHMFEHMAFKGTREIGTTNHEAELKWMNREDSIFSLILDEKSKFEYADSARLVQLTAMLQEASDSAKQYVVSNEYGQIYEREGGIDINAGTGYDMTAYFSEYPANRLELWMAMESDRFINPVMREFYTEKQVIAEERRMTRESSPQGKLQDEFLGAAFKDHPYGISLIGPMSDIQNFSRPVAVDYYKKYYVPTNMVIGIVGDVDPEQVHELAQKYFGVIPTAPKPRPILTVEARQNAERKIVLKDKAQPLYFTAFHIPDNEHSDWLALEALADYLGQGRTSQLYKNLVKDKKIAIQTAAFAGFPGSKYPTLFMIYSVPSKDHSNAENDAEILSEIERVKNETISAEELNSIKARAMAGRINELTSNGGLAFQLAYSELIKRDWRKLFTEIDRVNTLTSEDIKRVANEYLDINRRTVGFLESEE